MVLRVQQFDLSLSGLPEFLVAAIDRTPDARQRITRLEGVDLVGPFPSFYADPRVFATAQETAELVGWRALIRHAEKALGVVEIADVNGEAGFSFRGAEAAMAFEQVLSAAGPYHATTEPLEVRWLTMPEVYFSALWLRGEKSLFFPTRIGGERFVADRELDDASVAVILQRLVRQASGSARGRLQTFNDGLEGARSGLPE